MRPPDARDPTQEARSAKTCQEDRGQGRLAQQLPLGTPSNVLLLWSFLAFPAPGGICLVPTKWALVEFRLVKRFAANQIFRRSQCNI